MKLLKPEDIESMLTSTLFHECKLGIASEESKKKRFRQLRYSFSTHTVGLTYEKFVKLCDSLKLPTEVDTTPEEVTEVQGALFRNLPSSELLSDENIADFTVKTPVGRKLKKLVNGVMQGARTSIDLMKLTYRGAKATGGAVVRVTTTTVSAAKSTLDFLRVLYSFWLIKIFFMILFAMSMFVVYQGNYQSASIFLFALLDTITKTYSGIVSSDLVQYLTTAVKEIIENLVDEYVNESVEQGNLESTFEREKELLSQLVSENEITSVSGRKAASRCLQGFGTNRNLEACRFDLIHKNIKQTNVDALAKQILEVRRDEVLSSLIQSSNTALQYLGLAVSMTFVLYFMWAPMVLYTKRKLAGVKESFDDLKYRIKRRLQGRGQLEDIVSVLDDLSSTNIEEMSVFEGTDDCMLQDEKLDEDTGKCYVPRTQPELPPTYRPDPVQNARDQCDWRSYPAKTSGQCLHFIENIEDEPCPKGTKFHYRSMTCEPSDKPYDEDEAYVKNKYQEFLAKRKANERWLAAQKK